MMVKRFLCVSAISISLKIINTKMQWQYVFLKILIVKLIILLKTSDVFSLFFCIFILTKTFQNYKENSK